MDILERIAVIQDENTDSMRAFELSIGKTSGYIGMMRQRKSSPSSDVLYKILSVYKQYSAEWLLMGIGEKTKQPDGMVLEPTSEYGLSDSKMMKHLEEWVRTIVKSETDSQFEDVNTSIYTLLKRDFAAMEKSIRKKQDAG